MRKEIKKITEEDLGVLKYQARSKIKFNCIKEVIDIYSELNEWNSKTFENAMNKKGWKVEGTGLFKICLSKKSIVVKFPNRIYCDHLGRITKEIRNEYDQWVNPKCRKFKKYLPQSYILLNDKILIQDKVMILCGKSNNYIDENNCIISEEQRLEVHSIGQEHCLDDFIGNHGHTLKGSIKFYDSVWKRDRESY